MGTSSPPDFLDRLRRFAAAAEARARTRPAQALFALALIVYGVNVTTRRMGDYDVYHRAAVRLVQGEPVYRLADPHRYLYAPIFPFLFVPLAPVAPIAGKVLWLLANLWLALDVVRRSIALAVPEGRAPPGLTLLVVVLSLRFFDNNIAHGQMNLLMLWLILAAYGLAARNRNAGAGLALGAAISTKLVPGVFFLHLALRKRWRFAFATLVGLLLLFAFPAVWWGAAYPDVLRSWVVVVTDQATHYELGNKINQSISAFFYRAFRPYPGGTPLVELPAGIVAGLTLTLHAAFLGALAWRSTRQTEAPATEIALYLLYATVLSPYSWKYYFVNLVPAFALAARRLWEPRPGPAAITLGLVFLLNALPGQSLFGKRIGLLFQLWSFHFLAVVALFVLLLASHPPGRRLSKAAADC